MNKKLALLLIILMINGFIIVPVPKKKLFQTDKVQISFIFSKNFQKNFRNKQIEKDLRYGQNVVYNLNQLIWPISRNIKLDEAYSLNWYYHNKRQTNFSAGDNYGRFYIPDVGINVSLTYIDNSNFRKAAQAVNDDDSAAFLLYDSSPVIADHNYQGFSNIKDCIIGTKAFIKQKNKILVYECVGIDRGINNKKVVYDSRGMSIYSYSSNILTLYTCDLDWQHVYLVKFRKAECLTDSQFVVISNWDIKT